MTFHKSLQFHCVKQIADPAGRYLLLCGRLQDQEITILTYYAPNKKQVPFLPYVFTLLTSHGSGFLVPCGDSNFAVYP